jgi:DNA-binding Lrp family transcriptional regulator
MSADREDLEAELLDAYEAPPDGPLHPATVAHRVMKLDEHKHLVENEIRFLFLLRYTPDKQGGREVIGRVSEPQVQGRMRELFEHLIVKAYGFLPDYIVTISADFWREATDLQREALMHHELSHVQQALDRDGEPRFNTQTGEPIYCLVAHDIEEFNKTVERYGLWKDDVRQFAETCARVER